MTTESKYISVQIIDDSDDETLNKFLEEEEEIIIIPKKKIIRKTKETKKAKDPTITESIVPSCLLQKSFNPDLQIIEIGADEVGRGPMFGRVYCAAAVLPKDDSFDHYKMKDSKKFTSKNTKKIEETSEYIKEHAIAWAIEYEDEKVIDEINILQATQSAMHKAIKNVINQLLKKDTSLNLGNILLLIDGNYFKPFLFEKSSATTNFIKFQTIEGGDNKYTAIAAASILAKVERDKYIKDLCLLHPELIEKYGLDSNKGYGSKTHIDGIKQYGITKWHRRTFGICKMF
jgi:ribonuclease HII